MPSTIRDLTVVSLPVAGLQTYPGNARTHSRSQIQQIARSIETFGWTNPILIDPEGIVIAGHGRLAAAKLLRLDRVPTIRITDLTPEQRRAYVLADNKLAENAGWDRELLAIELEGLIKADLDFEIDVTGFSMGEIDVVIGPAPADAASPDPADAWTDDDDAPPVSRRGDLWRLGPHRLLCGDALCAADYQRLMGREKAGIAFTDPPYNVPIAGHVSGKGRRRHRAFPMAAGEMTPENFTGFLQAAFTLIASNVRSGAIAFVCMDWRHQREILEAGTAAFIELKAMCVWSKGAGGMGSLYRSAHELVFVFKAGTGRHVNNVALGAHGRNRTNVWSYPGMASFGRNRDDALDRHPTVKPVALVAAALLDCSRRKDIVLDPFGGSGTTLIAAHRTGRRARVIEIDPLHVDGAVRRFQAQTGEAALHAETGVSFAQLAEARGNTPAEAPDHPRDGEAAGE